MKKEINPYEQNCFFMIYSIDYKEVEKIIKKTGIWGAFDIDEPLLKDIKPGDIGFLYFPKKDELFGVFVALSKIGLYDPNWTDGKYPPGKLKVQVKLKPLIEPLKIIQALLRKESVSSVIPRIKSQLLRLFSMIFEEDRYVLIMAATNKPYEIDEAFLRPKRFDQIIYAGLPTKENLKKLLKLKLEKRIIPQLISLTEQDYDKLSDKLQGFTGADIEKLVDCICVSMVKNLAEKLGSRIHEIIDEIPNSWKLTIDKIEAIIEKERIRPSVSEIMLNEIKK